MTRITAVALAALLSAAWVFPAGAQASGNDSTRSGCTPDKVAVIRCETDSDGGIKVRNSSLTSATEVVIQRGDRCAAAISGLLQAGLRMADGPKVTTSPLSGTEVQLSVLGLRASGPEVSFSFVFLACEGNNDRSDDNRDDC